MSEMYLDHFGKTCAVLSCCSCLSWTAADFCPFEPALPPRCKYRHRHGVGKIQAAIVGQHRQAYTLSGIELAEHVGRQAATLGAEQERISRLIMNLMESLRALGGKREYSRRFECSQAIRQSFVDLQGCEFMIIQSCAHQLLVFEHEAQRLDQMQPAAGIGAQADDVTGIRRDFRLIQDHMEHRKNRQVLVS